MNAFWALVRNDLRIKRNRYNHPAHKFYAVLAIILCFAAYTYSLLHGNFNPLLFIFVTPVFLFILFGLSLFHVLHERKTGTAAWWLSLPYSRKFLLGAKITAIVLRFLRILLSLLLVLLLIELEAALLRPEIWTGVDLQDVMFSALRLLGYLLLQVPIVTLIFVTIAVLQGSVWRAKIPLFLVGFIVIMNLFGSTIFKPFQFLAEIKPEEWAQYHVGLPSLPSLTLGITTGYVLIYVICLPIALFLFSSLVLDRFTEVR